MFCLAFPLERETTVNGIGVVVLQSSDFLALAEDEIEDVVDIPYNSGASTKKHCCLCGLQLGIPHKPGFRGPWIT